jgi:predicted nucleic acid-binding protein
MRYIVLDTDVASRIIKRQLDGPLAARLTGAEWCVTFVTVGELWQWATMRSWGRRTREELEGWLGGVVVPGPPMTLGSPHAAWFMACPWQP